MKDKSRVRKQKLTLITKGRKVLGYSGIANTVRPQMLKLGIKLKRDPQYPTGPIIQRLARLFAQQILAERN